MAVNAVRLNHAVLFVADLERSLAFYQQAFGMTVVAREPRASAAFLRLPRSGQPPRPRPLRRRRAAAAAARAASGSTTWPGRSTPSRTSHQARTHARRAWSAYTGESSHGATKSLYGRDPDGNEFEVMWMLPKASWGEYENAAPVDRLDLAGEVRRWAGVARPQSSYHSITPELREKTQSRLPIRTRARPVGFFGQQLAGIRQPPRRDGPGAAPVALPDQAHRVDIETLSATGSCASTEHVSENGSACSAAEPSFREVRGRILVKPPLGSWAGSNPRSQPRTSTPPDPGATAVPRRRSPAVRPHDHRGQRGRVTGIRLWFGARQPAEAQKTVQSEYVVNASSAASPAAELPEGPSAGLHTHATPRSGMTARMPPPTPLLAGSPTR